MSLEDAVHRLANAIGRHEDTAVQEIIRQRDKALSDLASVTRDRDWQVERRDSNYNLYEREKRSNASLRGVITRMKKSRTA